MKKGFYEEIILDKKEQVKSTYDLYEFMTFTPVGDKCMDLYKYLNELDDEFSICLADRFGYDVNILVKYDSELDRDVLVHAYNSIRIDGKEVFVDARGVTSDINDIFELVDDEERDYYRVFKFNTLNAAKEKLMALTGVKYESESKYNELAYILNSVYKTYYII